MTASLVHKLTLIPFAAALVALGGCATAPELTPEQEEEARLDAEIGRMEGLAALSPKDGAAQYGLGNALFDAKRYREALGAYERAVRLDPDHADAYNNVALCYRRLGDLLGALAAYQKALAIAPDDETILQNYILALQAGGRFGATAEPLERLVRLVPGDVRLRHDLAKAWMEQAEYGKALAVWVTALPVDPGNVADLYDVGVCHFYLDDLDAAIESWVTCVGRDPGYGAAYRGLGTAYWRKGRYDAAWNAVQHTQRLGVPIDPEFLLNLQKDSGRIGPGVEAAPKEKDGR